MVQLCLEVHYRRRRGEEGGGTALNLMQGEMERGMGGGHGVVRCSGAVLPT